MTQRPAYAGVDISKEKLLAITEAKRDSIQSMKFSGTRRYFEYVSLPEGAPGTEGPGSHWEDYSFAEKGGMRYLRKTYGSSPNPEDVIRTTIETWDGTQFRMFEPADSAGYVTEHFDYNDSWLKGEMTLRMSPLDFLLTPSAPERRAGDADRSLPILLPDAAVTIADGYDDVDGSRCVVLNVSGRPCVWLDVDKGYAAKQKVTYLDHLKDQGGGTRKVVICHDYVELSPGLWIPTSGSIQWYGQFTDTPDGSKGVLLTENVYAFKEIEINGPIDDALFRVEFPKGTAVHDRDADVRYVAGIDFTESLMRELSKVNSGDQAVASVTPKEEGPGKSIPNGHDTRVPSATTGANGDRSIAVLAVMIALLTMGLIAAVARYWRSSRVCRESQDRGD